MSFNKQLSSIYKANSGKFVRFLAAGLPSFLLAIPLNILLVELLRLPKVPAYCLVLLFQITINFFMLRRFTFSESGSSSARRKFSLFMLGILGFRVLDAGLYALLVQALGLYYLLAQLFNVGLFSIAKFFFSKRVFEGKQT
jgi:putative flippase GtrA